MGLSKAHPCGKQYRITQWWGENPEAYSRFGLLGHNGIDIAVPVGTAIYATDAGRVIETGNDTAGYGLYAKLDHEWGESLYAHLSQIVVARGDAVGAGQRVGMSGNTGNSTGPHLHFGLRVKPYVRDDGWGGYSDPWPHLRERPNVDQLGPHLAGPQVGNMLETLSRWRPAFAVYLDPSLDLVQQINTASPATEIVGRIYRPDSEVADRIKANPTEAAAWMDGLIRSHEAFGVCDYWQIANEVCQVDWSDFRKLCQCMTAWMSLARNDYKCAIFGFSVGQPDMPENDRMAYWRETIPALERAIAGGHVLLIHQYGAPDLWSPDDDWYINRFEHQVWPRLGYLDKERPSRGSLFTLKSLRVVVGEYGVDGLLFGERKGWRGYGRAESYYEQLRNMAGYLEKWPTIEGYCLYTCGHASEEWASYDIWPEVAQALAADNPALLPPPSFSEALMAAADKAQVIQFNPAAALQKRIFADSFVPNSPETSFSFDGVTYVAQRAEHLRTGEVRAYYAKHGDWENIAFAKK